MNLNDWEIEEMRRLSDLLKNYELGDMEQLDEMVWNLDVKNAFSVSSMFGALCPQVVSSFLGRCVWNNLIPLKVSSLLWEVWRERALTINNVIARGLVIPNWYCLCKSVAETTRHLFIHCPWVAKFWNFSLNRFGVTWVQPSCVGGLLESWLALFIGGGSEFG